MFSILEINEKKPMQIHQRLYCKTSPCWEQALNRQQRRLFYFFIVLFCLLTYSMWPKVLAHVKKIPIYSTKTIFFQKKNIVVISGWILTNFTPKHAELSIFWLFIYSLYCYELFLFVHNFNTTNKNWLWFSYIFQLKIHPKN